MVPFFTVAVFYGQYFFRHFDDNRLTSWKWAFMDVDLVLFVPVLLLGTILAYGLSKITLIYKKPLLPLLSFSFITAAIFWKEPEVIVDISRYFTQAKYLENYGIQYFIEQWGKDIFAWTDLPLIPFFYGIIFKYIGETRVYIQIFTTILFSLTVVITYFIGSTLWDEETGFSGGAFLLAIPYIYSQVPLMLVDIPSMFFLTLSVYLFIMAMEKGGIWIVFSSLAVVSAALTKYSTWMMLSVLAVVFVVYLFKEKDVTGDSKPGTRICIFRCAVVVLFAGLLMGLLIMSRHDVIFSQIQFLQEYQKPGLRRWGESFVSTFLFQMHPFLTLAAISSVIVAFRKRDSKYAIVLWLVLLIVLLQIRRSRYVLIAFPMFTLMGAYGLQMIRNIDVKRYIVSTAMVSSIIIAVFVYLPFLKAMGPVNFIGAGRYLDTLKGDTVEVLTVAPDDPIVSPSVSAPILDYHTRKRIIYTGSKDIRMSAEEIRESPLRFTWEYEVPDFYKTDGLVANSEAVAVVSEGRSLKFPQELIEKLAAYKKTKAFDKSTGIFRYRPEITIYERK
jgi:hypothetical protein